MSTPGVARTSSSTDESIAVEAVVSVVFALTSTVPTGSSEMTAPGSSIWSDTCSANPNAPVVNATATVIVITSSSARPVRYRISRRARGTAIDRQ